MTGSVSNKPQPWFLLGESRVRALKALVRSSTERWAQAWFASTCALAIEVASDESRALEAGLEAHSSTFGAQDADGEWLACLVTSRSLAAAAAGETCGGALEPLEAGTIARAIEDEM